MYPIDPESLTREKRLWNIFIQCIRIPGSKFNQITTFVVLVLLSLHVYYFGAEKSELLSAVRSWADMGISLSAIILGFLLAGFTIFSTLTKSDVFIDMLKINHPGSGLSYLKHYFFVLMKVFIVFLGLALFCLTVIIFGGQNGFFSALLNTDLIDLEIIKGEIIRLSYIILGTWLVYSFLLLKSFIFNIYQSVMIGLRHEIEKRQDHI